MREGFLKIFFNLNTVKLTFVWFTVLWAFIHMKNLLTTISDRMQNFLQPLTLATTNLFSLYVFLHMYFVFSLSIFPMLWISFFSLTIIYFRFVYVAMSINWSLLFFWPSAWHVEVARPGIKHTPEPQQWIVHYFWLLSNVFCVPFHLLKDICFPGLNLYT